MKTRIKDIKAREIQLLSLAGFPKESTRRLK